MIGQYFTPPPNFVSASAQMLCESERFPLNRIGWRWRIGLFVCFDNVEIKKWPEDQFYCIRLFVDGLQAARSCVPGVQEARRANTPTEKVQLPRRGRLEV